MGQATHGILLSDKGYLTVYMIYGCAGMHMLIVSWENDHLDNKERCCALNEDV
jgi:hypothetical protein